MIERARQREKPTPPSSRQLRRQRARRLALRYGLGVGLPTLLATIYYGLLATPQYDSWASIAVETTADPFAVPTSKGSKDVKLVRAYLQSQELVDLLAREQGLESHYRDARADFIARIGAKGDLAAYFQDKLDVRQETSSNLLKLRMRAFTPERAQAFLRAIIAAVSTKVRAISSEARATALKSAEERLAKARESGSAHDLQRAEEGLDRLQTDLALGEAFVVVVAEPSRSNHAAYPRRLWGIATVFTASLALVAMLSLLAAAVREHAQF